MTFSIFYNKKLTDFSTAKISSLSHVHLSQFPLAKFGTILPVTVKRNCTCLGQLWRCDKNRNDPISVMPPKVAEASTITCHCRWHCRQCK